MQVIKSSYVDELVGKQVLFKCEVFQKGYEKQTAV